MTCKKVAIFGATSGIGRALAERFVETGSLIIAIGRRKENLDALVNKYDAGKVEAAQFDITKLEDIDGFVEDLTKRHPDLDCAFMNSGIQRSIDFNKPDTVDMTVVNEEMVTNYLSPLQLTKAFVKFFQTKPTEAALIYTTSSLAIVPMLRVPNYCASKAAMHHFILVLREQVKSSNIKVVEIFPPLVQTELHDLKHQPELKGTDLYKIGGALPLEEFTNKAWEKLVEGREEIPVGMAEMDFETVEKPRREQFNKRLQRARSSK